MRLVYSGAPNVFPDLGPYEWLAGDVVEVPEELVPSFLQRPDFKEATAKAKLTDPSTRSTLKVEEPEVEVEPELVEETQSVQGADVSQEASASTD